MKFPIHFAFWTRPHRFVFTGVADAGAFLPAARLRRRPATNATDEIL
jgi:hypothetical protein